MQILLSHSLSVGLMAMTVVGIAAEPASRPVWPPAPDTPRVAFVQAMHGPADIGQSRSLASKLGQWLTGAPMVDLQLQKPCGVAIDENGALYVTDTAAKRINVCDLRHKRWRVVEQCGKTHFVSPVGVACHKGVIYLADSGLGKVLALTQDGALRWEIAKPLSRPVGVAVARDCLAVVDSQAHKVFVFDLNGHSQFNFGCRGVGDGEFNFPTHITADRQDHWVITDAMNCRIQVFDHQGRFISRFGSNGDTSGHFGRPKGVAVDRFGRIYVVDALFDNFQVFESDGTLLLNVGQSGTGSGEFGLPAGIAIAGDNRIYVADSYNHRLQVFQSLGEP